MQTAGATGAAAGRPRAQPPRALRLATTVSVVVHGGLLAAALAVPTSRMRDDERVTVDIVEAAAAPPAPPAPAVEPPTRKPQLVRAAMPKKARPIETTAAAPAAAPPAEPSGGTAPPAASAPTTDTTPDPDAVRVASAPTGAGLSGGGPGVPGGRPLVGAPTESQRRGLADRYRDDLLRTRIRGHFRYPAEALELELTGRVIVQVTVDRNGRLLSARLGGGCPHQLLCEDGLRTVRAAAPFPALPSELGDTLRIEIPLSYELR